MDNLKIYQICHHLITYFATLISPIKSQLGPVFRTGGSTMLREIYVYLIINNYDVQSNIISKTGSQTKNYL